MKKAMYSLVLGVAALAGTLLTPSSAKAFVFFYLPIPQGPNNYSPVYNAYPYNSSYYSYYTPGYSYSYVPVYSYYVDPGYYPNSQQYSSLYSPARGYYYASPVSGVSYYNPGR